jgi:hypothetical protein
MSLWLAIGAGITFCVAALFELVRPLRVTRGPSIVLALALLAGAAVAFSVAGLAHREHKPATPAPASYFGSRSGGGCFAK